MCRRLWQRNVLNAMAKKCVEGYGKKHSSSYLINEDCHISRLKTEIFDKAFRSTYPNNPVPHFLCEQRLLLLGTRNQYS